MTVFLLHCAINSGLTLRFNISLWIYFYKPKLFTLPYHLITYLLACLFTYLLITYLLTYLLIYLLACLLICLLACLLAYLLTHSLTHSLTPWSRVLEQLTGFQFVKKFPTFYGTRRLITAFTSAPPSVPILSQLDPVHTPTSTSWRSILVLFSHLCLGLPSGLFPSYFPTKTLYAPLLSPVRATCLAHLILIDFITRTILVEQYRSLTLRRLMSYIYGAPILDVSRSHTTTQHSR